MPDSEGWGAAQTGNFIVSAVPLGLWLLALLFTAISVWRASRPLTPAAIADALLRYIFIFPLGVQGIWAFLCHVFIPEQAAAAIGWAPSPFQYEVGVANLGIALASFYAAFSSFRARVAVAVMAGCFLAGAGLGHLMDIADEGNLAPGNAGPILITDFLTPIAVIALLLLLPAKQPQAQLGPRISEQLAKAREELEKGLGGKGRTAG